ncbi:MAG: hypothetical protein J2P37_00290 [Ktedonobacteraceae bacterium]|nr:hypothetical protein [Ktedonobacteraceae bacterium]
MLIIETDAKGNTTFRHVDDPPNNFECEEWKAYEAACVASEEQGLGYTDEMRELYAKYLEANKAF